jgi:transposase
MGQDIKKNHPPAFKEKVAIEAIRGAETPGQLATRFSIHPIQIGVWKKQAITAINQFFTQGAKKKERDYESEMEDLFKKVGKLQVENDFLKKKVGLIE